MFVCWFFFQIHVHANQILTFTYTRKKNTKTHPILNYPNSIPLLPYDPVHVHVPTFQNYCSSSMSARISADYQMPPGTPCNKFKN